MEHSRKKLDLTGQRFGKLIVLAPAENIGNRTAWLCRCDCGREQVVKTYRLRDGEVTSCGCDRPHAHADWAGNEAISKGAAGRASLTYVDGTCVEVLAAKTVRSNNTSGVPGVDWQASKGRWRAAICFKGKRYYLGSYGKFEDAVKARKRAEEELHDKFLREFALAAKRRWADSQREGKEGDAMQETTPPEKSALPSGRTAGREKGLLGKTLETM